MGATFPTLTRHLARSSQLSRAFGRLYAANTFGAILGTLAAGLVLIELFGLSQALVVGAGCSLVAGTRRALAQPGRPRGRRRAAPDGPAAPPSPRAPGRRRPPPDADRDRPDDRVRVRADLARIPGHLDAPARIGHRQHDVRVHGHPGRVPRRHRPRAPSSSISSGPGCATRSRGSRSPRSSSRGWPSLGSSSCSAARNRLRPIDRSRRSARCSGRSCWWSCPSP